MGQAPDPEQVTLEEWLRFRGTMTGTYTFNGITYTSMAEVEWRRANDEWRPEVE